MRSHRKTDIHVLTVLLGTLLTGGVLAACGGSQPAEETTPADDEYGGPPDLSLPGEMESEAQQAATEPEMEADPGADAPDAPVAGPTQVTVQAKLGTRPTDQAEVAILDQAGETVVEGRSGQTFTIDAGEYTAVARVTSDRVLLDAPVEATEPIVLEAGDPQTVEVSVPVARVRLVVQRNGRPMRNPLVKLYREGGEEPVATFRASNEHVAISPGRYVAEVRAGNQDIRVSGLTFMDGATQNIPVNVQ